MSKPHIYDLIQVRTGRDRRIRCGVRRKVLNDEIFPLAEISGTFPDFLIFIDMPSCPEAFEAEDPPSSLKRAIEDDISSSDFSIRKTKRRRNAYQCPFEDCLKTFNRPCRLQEHLNSHTGDVLSILKANIASL